MTARSWVTSGLFIVVAAAGLARAQTPELEAWKILETGTTNTNATERATAVRVLGLIPDEYRAVEMA